VWYNFKLVRYIYATGAELGRILGCLISGHLGFRFQIGSGLGSFDLGSFRVSGHSGFKLFNLRSSWVSSHSGWVSGFGLSDLGSFRISGRLGQVESGSDQFNFKKNQIGSDSNSGGFLESSQILSPILGCIRNINYNKLKFCWAQLLDL
jgi:hypothetical protein